MEKAQGSKPVCSHRGYPLGLCHMWAAPQMHITVQERPLQYAIHTLTHPEAVRYM